MPNYLPKCLVAVAFAVITGTASFSQKARPFPGENSIVKDSTGQTYTKDAWTRLLITGYYTIKPANLQDENSEYILVRLSEEERERRIKTMPKPRESKSFVTGEKMPEFSFKDIEGNKYKLKDLNGKVVVFNFWFINCPPCQMEIPDLNGLVGKFTDSTNVKFFAIALDDKSDLKSFLKKKPFNYNIVSDGKSIAGKLQISGYPTHVIVDQQGNISFHTTGLGINTVYWIEKSIRELIQPK